MGKICQLQKKMVGGHHWCVVINKFKTLTLKLPRAVFDCLKLDAPFKHPYEKKYWHVEKKKEKKKKKRKKQAYMLTCSEANANTNLMGPRWCKKLIEAKGQFFQFCAIFTPH